MFTRIVCINQDGDTRDIAEGEGYLPIPNVSDTLSDNEWSANVKSREFNYKENGRAGSTLTVTLTVHEEREPATDLKIEMW